MDQPRLPARIRISYGFASLAGNAVSRTWGLWLIYFYAPPEDASIGPRIADLAGLDARVVLGIALALIRIVEAVDDPLIGYWTDRTSSRWGRRLPFIIFFTPPWMLLFFLLFLPPVSGASTANLVYLVVLVGPYFAFGNLSGAAQEALLPHLAKLPQDRLSVATWQLLFGVLGAVVGLSLSSLLVDWLGYAAMAATIAFIAFLVRYSAAALIWPYARTDTEPSTPGFGRSIRDTISNPQFIAYLPSFVLFQVGLQMLTALLPFYVEAILEETTLFGIEASENTGTFTFILTATVIAGVICAIPFVRRISARHGKANAYRVAMVTAAAWFPVLFIAGFIPGAPDLGEAVVAVFIAGMACSGVFFFPNIITADIVDDDATRTDTRREAMFYGTQNMLEKTATAFSPLIFALVLLAGDTSEDPLGIRLVGPVAGLLVLGAWISFRRYTLDPEGAGRG
jgi:GPH family glycoside/pentoside/hexuronide:cation symporter